MPPQIQFPRDKEREWTLNADGEWEDRDDIQWQGPTSEMRKRKTRNNARRAWLREVDRKNEAIFNKIATIRHRGGVYNQARMRPPPRHRGGLHFHHRRNEWDRIHRENQGILNRLNHIKPTLRANIIGKRRQPLYGNEYDDEHSSVEDQQYQNRQDRQDPRGAAPNVGYEQLPELPHISPRERAFADVFGHQRGYRNR